MQQNSKRLLAPFQRTLAALRWAAPTQTFRQHHAQSSPSAAEAPPQLDGVSGEEEGAKPNVGARSSSARAVTPTISKDAGFSSAPSLSIAARLKASTRAASTAVTGTGRRRRTKQQREASSQTAKATTSMRADNVDEVDAVLAHLSTIPPPRGPVKPPPTLSPTPATSGEEVVFDELNSISTSASQALQGDAGTPRTEPPSDSFAERPLSELSPLELTRRSLNIGETVTSGAATSTLEQIERRRSKFSVSETEFDVGITERLFPEIRRLPALHEVHFGDAVVREVDSSTYFCDESLPTTDSATQRDLPSPPRTSTDGVDRSLRCDAPQRVNAFDDEAFALFDAQADERARPTTEAEEALGEALVAEATAAEAASAAVLKRGTKRPWFIRGEDHGAVRLHPVPPEDCLLLLRFLLRLRNQTVEDLPKAMQRKVSAVTQRSGDGTGGDASTSPPVPLAMRDLIKYLDSAPAPVVGLTECLHHPLTRKPLPSPAFLFTLYMENVSFHNAVAHLAMLFSVPIKAFQSHSRPSKMSCASILCCVARDTLRREHLLLINTLRLPGFVLRVSDVREIEETAETLAFFQEKHEDAIVGDLVHWDPVYEAEVLLRRVSCEGRYALEHRLRAAQQVGAVFFTASREASLARAATDVLHGFFKSAVVNALYRPKQPRLVKEFMRRPNVVTAARARSVTTDSVVKQTLRAFIQTNGDWRETIRRIPFSWRRRWLNTLRSIIWNKMASRRVRVGGRSVMVGDAVVKPEYRDDVQRRMVPTVLSEHVKIVETEEEAAQCSLEDVFIPFLRGTFPRHFFAPESTNHPIMTEANLLSLLRENHAPQLLLGMPDEALLLLDVRGDSGTLLWRRLLIRPVAMQFTILEDKAPMRSVHFDAGRLLANDRWHANARTRGGTWRPTHQGRAGATHAAGGTSGGTAAAERSGDALFPSPTSALIPQSVVLEKSTIGARLQTGFLSEEFFDIPSAEHYVVLGQAQRNLTGTFVPAKPQTPEDELGDRLYTVHIRAVTRTGVAGITQVLREYFVLTGIEQESDSALQHRIHRIRRELDPETRLLTAPTYCEVCYNRDHTETELCAEYYYKVHKRGSEKLIEDSLRLQQRHKAKPSAFGGGSPKVNEPSEAPPLLEAPKPEGDGALTAGDEEGQVGETRGVYTIFLELHLRRGQGQKWGVNMTNSLRLAGLDDPSLVKGGALTIAAGRVDSADRRECAGEGAEKKREGGHSADEGKSPFPPAFLLAIRKRQLLHRSLQELQAALARPTGASPAAEKEGGSEDRFTHLHNVEGFLSALLPSDELQRVVVSPGAPPRRIPLSWAPASGAGSDKRGSADAVGGPGDGSAPFAALAARILNSHQQRQGNTLLKGCGWRMVRVDEEEVRTPRDVARVFIQRSKSVEVRVTFATTVRLSPTREEAEATRGAANEKKGVGSAGPHAERLTSPTVTETELHRWARSLPDSVTVLLTKTLADAASKDPRVASWGVQLHARDLTLVSLSKLVAHALGATACQTRRAERTNGAAPEEEASKLCVRVSITPAEVLDEAKTLLLAPTARRRGEGVDAEDTVAVDPMRLAMVAPTLDAMYTITRLDGVAVASRQVVSSTLRALQQRIAHSLEQKDSVKPGEGGDTASFVHLPLVLKRRPAAGGPKEGKPTSQGVEEPSLVEKPSGEPKGGAEEAATAAAPVTGEGASESPAVTAPLVPCVPHQTRMTSDQAHNSLATVAVNRLLLTSQTAGKWGLKIQSGTLRLKYIQFNRYFTFQVFTAKRNHAVRMQDTLRFLSSSASSSEAVVGGREEEDGRSGNAVDGRSKREAAAGERGLRGGVKMVFSHYAYFIRAVNYQKVSTFAELRDALRTAALTRRGKRRERDGFEEEEEVPADDQGPESVTLSVKQFRLMHLTAVVKRGGGPGEPSPLAPVGLSINNSLVILSVEENSPMATAILQATGEASSLRLLIGKRASVSPFAHTSGKGKGLPVSNNSSGGGGAERTPSSLTEVVVAPVLAEALERVFAACGIPTSRATRVERAQRQRAWQYAFDEDEEGHKHDDGEAANPNPEAPAQSLLSTEGRRALSEAFVSLNDTCEKVLNELDTAVSIDAVHLLQASLLRDFSLSQLQTLSASADSEAQEESTTKPVAEELKQLLEKLEEVHEDVCWRVVYATRSGATLRTTQEVANAIAPGVAEEGLVLQQCLVGW